MADMNPYRVFLCFDSPTLLDEKQRQRVLNYLSIRRKSGGGECETLTRVDDRVYAVAFRNQKDQQSVLQRREHVVPLTDGPLVFTVRAALAPDTSAPTVTFSMNPDLTPPPPSPQSIPASTPPSSGEEYELRPDTYLLNYLKEFDKAGRDLEIELNSVACTAQLYPEEGRVLVRRLGQPEAGRNWKAEVDKIFDGYMCHFEVDRHKVKALLQPSSSHKDWDEVKVYEEVGMVVVVGKCSQVNARLMDVEDHLLKFQSSRLNEKCSSIWRLGEAKLCLLWGELENGLRENFPGVKVTRGDPGQVVLEGSFREIQEAGDWISEKQSLVSERTVTNMSPHLLAFLRNAYKDRGMLREHLQVGKEVEIELQDMKLSFLSLFVDKLDAAEEALQGKFKEVEIDVPKCCTFSVELQRMVKSKSTELNRWQYRVNVLFNANNTMCFLGHTKEVDTLSEAVGEFILQSTIPLPFPEFAQELPELLRHQGVDFTGVTFHPFLGLFSEPLLVLDGPSSKVTEVRNLLCSFLGPSAPCSNDSMQLAPTLNEGNTASYSVCDGLQVVVCQGDITKQDAEALVNAANEDLNHCQGVAAALSDAGGPQVQRESNDIVKRNGKIPVGEVVTTTGGNLRCHRLLHAVGPGAREAGGRERSLLEKTIQSTLNKAEGMGMFSIAIPCISSNVFGVPMCSEAIVTAVKAFANQFGRGEERCLNKIILIDNREEVARAMREACDRLLLGNSSRLGTPRVFPMDVDDHNMDRGAPAGPPADGVIEIVQETIENQQVDAVVSPMDGHNPLSSKVGNSLAKIVGPPLTAGFQKEAGLESFPGDAVLVQGFRGHPFNAVFFLNLCPFDGDANGSAVQVLRMGIKQILYSCVNSGFGSVAFPVLGAGINLKFPTTLAANVLLEEIREFKQNQVNAVPLLIRIAIHPNDTKAAEVFKQFLKDSDQPDQVSTPTRIFLLGKTGSGKSTLANSIFGEENLFPTGSSFTSKTSKCQAETRSVNGRRMTLLDTPGFFDTDRQGEVIRSEMVRGITECAPGPHVFLIVLKIERFTQQEQDVIKEIELNFSEDALKFAVIIFTHGDQLTEGSKIQDLICENRNLHNLVQRCGGRYHVFSNKPQKKEKQSNYSSKQVQDLLSTIDKMMVENNGCCYTNEKLQAVRDDIQMEVECVRNSAPNMSQEEILKQAKVNVANRLLISLAGIGTGALLGAFFALAFVAGFGMTAVNFCQQISKLAVAKNLAGAVTIGNLKLVAAGVAGSGAIAGGVIGYSASRDAQTPLEAAELASQAVHDKYKSLKGK